MGAAAKPLGAARLGELAVVCGQRNSPSQRVLLSAELRAAGYLRADDDLDRMLAAGDHPGLDTALPDDLCVRLLDTLTGVRFLARGGRLRAAWYRPAPLSAADAFRRYGMALLARAVTDAKGRADLPGEGGRRAWSRFLHGCGVLVVPVLGPVSIAVLVGSGVRRLARRGTWPDEPVARRMESWNVQGVFITAALPAAVYAAVCWGWLSRPLPPAGAVARPVVAALAADAASLLVLLVWLPLIGLQGMGVHERAGRRARGES